MTVAADGPADPPASRASARSTRKLGYWAPLASLWLTGCTASVLDPKGPVGSAETSILGGSLAIMLAIVVPTMAATLAFAWWFRASNPRALYRPDWAYSGRIELMVWAIPVLTITLLGGVAWIGSHELDPARPLVSDRRAIEVQVVSLDWKWLFIYPGEHVASVNQFVVPAGVPVHFSLTSGSVMNAFFVPQLGSMIYTMNGMATQLNLMADRPGTFQGRSAHFSGDGFSDMHFDMRAVPPDEFSAWVEQTRTQGAVLDRAGYAELARQGTIVQPMTYSQADPNLFDDIVRQKLPPGPGPDVGRPGPSLKPLAEH